MSGTARNRNKGSASSKAGPGISRRTFGRSRLLGGSTLALPGIALAARPPYRGPNVIIIRFGGGVRRRETIEPPDQLQPLSSEDACQAWHTLSQHGVGNPSHYTRGIATIDDGIRQLVEAADARDSYRDSTVFVIVPDCGRDDNLLTGIPFQHHFNSRSAHEIFALLMGPGIAAGKVVTREVQQTDIAPTLGRLMGMSTPATTGSLLRDAFA